MPADDQHPTVLVTGGARRVGAAIVRELHRAGCDVVIHCRNSRREAATLQAELETQRHVSTLLVSGDLADPATAPDLVARALGRFGKLDGLVNNAAIYHASPLPDATVDDWDRFQAINARAPFLLSQAAGAALAGTGGAIVNITDHYADHPQADYIPYAASKAALVAVTRGLAKALAPAVRVNAIAPGAIIWPEDGQADAERESILARTLLQRVGEPADIASTVRWLLLEATFVTGQVIHVDGGR